MGGDEGQTGEQGADTITLRVREQTGDEMFFKVWAPSHFLGIRFLP
jgi:hypothetical protein